MNQKYLQGLSSNMESPNEAVFFEATPENITAFLMQHLDGYINRNSEDGAFTTEILIPQK